jgi:hypothetical protein
MIVKDMIRVFLCTLSILALVKQVNEQIEKYFQNNFTRFLIKNSKLMEGELVPRREFEVTKATVEKQVSQTNSIFMIADKCERFCREIEREFDGLKVG